jgi:hypothetical protein
VGHRYVTHLANADGGMMNRQRRELIKTKRQGLRLPDIGLSKRAINLRNRLSAVGFNLQRSHTAEYAWVIYRLNVDMNHQLALNARTLEEVSSFVKLEEQSIMNRVIK